MPNGTVKWFNKKKDMDLLNLKLKMKKMFLYIYLQLKTDMISINDGDKLSYELED